MADKVIVDREKLTEIANAVRDAEDNDRRYTMAEIAEKSSEWRRSIAEAITEKGIDTFENASFAALVTNIGRIKVGTTNSVSGMVTGVSNLTTIQHNLGTDKIIGIIYPVNNYVADGNGRAILKIFCSPAAILEGTIIRCDFSSYNSVASNPYVYSPEKSWALQMNGPSSTGTTVANSRSTSNSTSGDIYSLNAVELRALSAGQMYAYHVFAIQN